MSSENAIVELFFGSRGNNWRVPAVSRVISCQRRKFGSSISTVHSTGRLVFIRKYFCGKTSHVRNV
jgi:hypothetical protein